MGARAGRDSGWHSADLGGGVAAHTGAGCVSLAVVKLAVFDIDGTLIGSGREPSPGTLAALRQLHEAGVRVAPATSRPYQVALRPFVAAGVEADAIASAGADVRLAGGRVVRQTPMSPGFATFAAGLCDRAGWPAMLATAETIYQRYDGEPPAWASRAPAFMTLVPSLQEAAPRDPLVLLSVVDPADPHLRELGEWEGEVNVDSAYSFDGQWMVTATNVAADKGEALLVLCAALGIPPEEVVAFGDAEVDLPMFAVAGLSVAMGNASDAVKAQADMVTAPVDEEGIAEAVRRIWG